MSKPRNKKKHRPVTPVKPFSTSPTGAERKPARGGTPPKGRPMPVPPGPKRKNPEIVSYEDTSWKFAKKKTKKRGKK